MKSVEGSIKMKKVLANNSVIEANEIIIGENVTWGKDISIKVRGVFKIGANSHVGDRFNVKAENCRIGEYFYNNPTDNRGMRIGGGSSHLPFANLTIGDRVVCHTGHINLAQPVTIGNDVGLSHDVDIITHGFWGSVLDGYPRKVESVTIGNNVIIGWKTVIMAGVNIADDVVVGSHATIVKDLKISKAIYGGTPAKVIGYIHTLTIEEQRRILLNIVFEFLELLATFYIEKADVTVTYPNVYINGLKLNVEKKTCAGKHCKVSDAFRDHLRRYGIRIFHPRGFKFNLTRI